MEVPQIQFIACLCGGAAPFGRVTHAPADPEPCTKRYGGRCTLILGQRPGAPKWAPGWCRVRAGRAGGVVQFLDKVVDVPVVLGLVFVEAVQLLDKAADVLASVVAWVRPVLGQGS